MLAQLSIRNFALIDRLGLVATMLVSMTLAALGTPQTRWREYTLFAAFMVAVGVSLFIYGLRMPIPVLPKDLPNDLTRALPWR